MEKSVFKSNNEAGAVSLQSLLALVLFAAIVIVVTFGYLHYMKLKSPEGDMTAEQIESAYEEGARLLESGNAPEAILQFNKLLEAADTPEVQGQLKLNLGVAQLKINRPEGIALLKEVSLNEEYEPITRAKAVNHVLNEYTATKDVELAREHIFTGPTWGEFLEEGSGSVDAAVLQGFEFSNSIYPTPEALSRVATEYAKLLSQSSSQEEKEQYAKIVLENIDESEALIESLRTADRIHYGDTHYTEIAVAYNRIGTALDALYFEGYIDDADRVESAFQSAIDTLLENTGGDGTELFVRYHYADFLLRLDAEGRRESIVKTLSPMNKMTSNHNIASFLHTRISETALNQEKDVTEPARPDSIALLAEISPEFREALLNIGITESQIAAAAE